MNASPDKIKYISLEELFFDPDNPRLPQELKGNRDEKAIIDHMLRDESLIELMKSIGQTGYSVSEPLLVVPEDDHYLVVEGNRRLAALKVLSDPSLATVRRKSVAEVIEGKKFAPDLIPCILYECRDDILDYLGYRHITGVKNWGALEKARYLKQLYTRYNEKTDGQDIFYVLAKMIGSRRDYVAKLLTSYALYERANENAYYGIDISEKDIDFSLLSTALGYENIYSFIGLESTSDVDGKQIDDDSFKFLFGCLYDPTRKIQESRELKLLSSVLGNAQALEQYRAGTSLKVASYYTSEPVDAFIRFINEACVSLENAKGSVERIKVCDDDYKLITDKLEQIKKYAVTLTGSVMALYSEDQE